MVVDIPLGRSQTASLKEDNYLVWSYREFSILIEVCIYCNITLMSIVISVSWEDGSVKKICLFISCTSQ